VTMKATTAVAITGGMKRAAGALARGRGRAGVTDEWGQGGSGRGRSSRRLRGAS
jgi:hypothetical protein